MRILIIEDETLAADLICFFSRKYIAESVICAVCDSVESSVSWLKANVAPDLIFMDIQLADGISFEIFKYVQVKSPVIFTTAFDQYALQAFKVNSIDYLLKPIDEEAFHSAVQKFQDLHFKPDLILADKIQSLIQDGVLGKREFKSRFLLRKSDRLVPVETKEMSYIFSEDKSTLCMNQNAEKYFMDYTLDALEEILNPDMFFRLNRKYLIRREALKDIRLHLNGKLKISLMYCEDTEIFVSRERAGDFRKWLGA